MRRLSFPFRPATALAPLEGLTSPAIRNLIARRGGVGLVCTEFVRVYQRPRSAQLLSALQPPPGVALSVQLMGNDATYMAEATRLLAEAGADVVDINLGCPTKRAVRGNVGAGLLRNHDLLRRVLEAMRNATAGLVSAKLRAGFERLDEAFALGAIIEASGLDYLVVHPRCRADMYQGVADWRIVSALKRTLSIPVIGNGDTWYAAEALRLRAESACDGVMIGRPALRNPWIFRQLAQLEVGEPPVVPTGADLLAHLEELAGVFDETLPHHRRLGALKEHVRYLGRAVPDGASFIRRAIQLDTTAGILEFAAGYLAGLSSTDLDLAPAARHGLERVPAAC